MDPSLAIYNQLKECGVTFCVTYPGAKIQRLYELVRANIDSISVSKEEEGVGICAGVSLAGGKPAMLIQSTGLGNMINAICSLTLTYGLPLLVLASWRGVYKETVSAQIALGKRLPNLLKAIGCQFYEINTVKDIPKIAVAAQRAFEKPSVQIVLLSPQLWEPAQKEESTKTSTPSNSNPEEFPKLPPLEAGFLTRFEIIKILTQHIDNQLVICNIGLPSRELYEILDQPSNFYMLGSLGLVSSIGLGVAIKTPKPVFVIDGDGSLLSNLGSLATIASVEPPNLIILAIDNRVHGSTGNQPTATSVCVDLAKTAQSLGWKHVSRAVSPEQIREIPIAPQSGPKFIHLSAKPGNAEVPTIPLTPQEIKTRFMNAIRSKH